MQFFRLCANNDIKKWNSQYKKIKKNKISLKILLALLSKVSYIEYIYRNYGLIGVYLWYQSSLELF